MKHLLQATSWDHAFGYLAGAALFLVAATASFQLQAASDQAVVRALGPSPTEVGQALIVHSGGRCIALLPTHVVEEAGIASLRYVGTGTSSLGELGTTMELGDDLSLGTITGGLTRDCGHSIGSFSRAVDAKLSDGTQGLLRFVNGDGSLGFESVTWLDDDRRLFIRIQPTTPGRGLQKGMSGSLLMSRDNTPIGMLLSVSTDSGVGKIMRIDRILERAESALRGGRSAAPNRPLDRPQAEEKPAITLVAWSADAQSADARPRNLLATDEATGPWISTRIDKPVMLDFNLAEGTILSSVTLDGRGVAPDLLPRAAEVFVTSEPNFSRARSVWGGSLAFSDDAQALLRFAATRAAAIRVVLYPRGSQIGLGRVSIQP